MSEESLCRKTWPKGSFHFLVSAQKSCSPRPTVPCPRSRSSSLFRTPSPCLNFARFPLFPLLGGVTAVKRELVYLDLGKTQVLPCTEFPSHGDLNSRPLELGAQTKWLASWMLVWVSAGFSTPPSFCCRLIQPLLSSPCVTSRAWLSQLPWGGIYPYFLESVILIFPWKEQDPEVRASAWRVSSVFRIHVSAPPQPPSNLLVSDL